jgi:hypothetical protein
MGGFVPLGRDAKDCKLLVNDAEAALVRRIFGGFVETESGTKLVQALGAEGATTKRGRSFTWSDVYRVVSNRTSWARRCIRKSRTPTSMPPSCRRRRGTWPIPR